MRTHKMNNPCYRLWIGLILGLSFPLTTHGIEFHLVADTTSKTMPDNQIIPMWGFALDADFGGDGVVVVPGPRLVVPENETSVTIHMKNNLSVSISLVIPGQITNMTPVWFTDAQGRPRVKSFTQETAPGSTGTYTWSNFKAGTFLYQSGSHPAVQVQMGLYGGITKDFVAGQAYDGIDYDVEIPLLFSEIDPVLHEAVDNGTYGTPSMSSPINYRAKYFLINGQAYTDAIPPLSTGVVGQRVLLRLLNAGLETRAPMLLGVHLTAVAEDGYVYPYPRQQYVLALQAGKTIDAVVTFSTDGIYTVLDRRLSGAMQNILAGDPIPPPPPPGDIVKEWNQTTLMLNPSHGTLMGGRTLAMVHTAIYDAVVAFEGGYQPYRVTATPPAGASLEAAATAAAYYVLNSVFTAPDQQAAIQTRYESHLAWIADGPGKDAGIAFGQSIAQAILDLRATDGAMAAMTTPHPDGTEPGEWRRTSSGEPIAPGWGDVTPWTMTSGDQFDQGGPPALTSQAYADDFNETRLLGAKDSDTRTADQDEMAIFWLDHVPRHWHGLAREISEREGLSLFQNARLFALLSVAMADSNIASWNMKYSYNFWRPETAIHEGDADMNDATVGDLVWESFIPAPAFPEYVSGHSITSAAAAKLLELYFGKSDYTFNLTSMSNPELGPRTFNNFQEAAQEAGRSRIYGGIHFEFSNRDGLLAGNELADYVFGNMMVAIQPPGGGGGGGGGGGVDLCPNDPAKTDPGICRCGIPDTDTDGDSIADCLDECPNDPAKTEAGLCGCGVVDTDSDDDGMADCLDDCPDDPDKTVPGVCGCGVADADSDNDGVADCLDECPNTPAGTQVDAQGCPVPEDRPPADPDPTPPPDSDEPTPEPPSDNPQTFWPKCGAGVAQTAGMSLFGLVVLGFAQRRRYWH